MKKILPVYFIWFSLVIFLFLKTFLLWGGDETSVSVGGLIFTAMWLILMILSIIGKMVYDKNFKLLALLIGLAFYAILSLTSPILTHPNLWPGIDSIEIGTIMIGILGIGITHYFYFKKPKA